MTRSSRILLWLHEHSLPPHEREAVIGDLVEEFGLIASLDPPAARRWLWRQTLRSLGPNLARRRTTTGSITAPRVQGAGPMNGITTDLRFACRLMRRQPLVTAVAFVSLWVGLALNVLLFTLSNAVLFRPLALRAPHDLRVLLLQRPTGLMHNFSYPDYVVMRDGARLLDGLVAYGPADATASGPDGAQTLTGEVVSGNFFGVLGVPVRHGRALTPDDDRREASPAVVISHALWSRRFAGAPPIGALLMLNGTPFTVVGVAAASFNGMEVGRATEFWIPLAHSGLRIGADMLARPNASWLTVIARPAPGSSTEAAHQELDSIIRAAFEARGRQYEPLVLQHGARGDSMLPNALASPLWLLSGAGVLVLLVACMNVANLQLARAEARRLELAVRAALGARRSQLIRLMVVDALLLSACAGTAAVLAAALLKDRAASLIALFGRPVSLVVPVDASVIGVTLAFSIASGLLIGLLSTWQVSRRPVVGLADSRSVTATRRRLQQALVIAQFALSFAVLTGAALMVRSLANLRGTDLGFESRQLALLQVSPGLAQLAGAKAGQYLDSVVDALRAAPGVQSVAAAHVMPLDFGGSRVTVNVAGYTPRPDDEMEMNLIRVTPGYFETLRIPLRQGRAFSSRDLDGQPRCIVVNETMARRFWPNGSPVGRFVRLGDDGPYDIEVIGVVPDVHYRMVRERPRPSFYASLAQWPAAAAVLHVRVSGDPAPRLEEFRRLVASVNPAVPVGRVSTLRQQMERNIASERMATVIGMTLAVATLLLAAAGLYSTMAFVVGRRTREIGVRVALGARAPDVRDMVLRDAALLVIWGAGLGLAMAFWVGRALDNLLYGVRQIDYMSMAAAASILAAAALIASWVPARRAARVDPVIALRES